MKAPFSFLEGAFENGDNSCNMFSNSYTQWCFASLWWLLSNVRDASRPQFSFLYYNPFQYSSHSKTEHARESISGFLYIFLLNTVSSWVFAIIQLCWEAMGFMEICCLLSYFAVASVLVELLSSTVLLWLLYHLLFTSTLWGVILSPTSRWENLRLTEDSCPMTNSYRVQKWKPLRGEILDDTFISALPCRSKNRPVLQDVYRSLVPNASFILVASGFKICNRQSLNDSASIS